jgi:hypothetical protein
MKVSAGIGPFPEGSLDEAFGLAVASAQHSKNRGPNPKPTIFRRETHSSSKK